MSKIDEIAEELRHLKEALLHLEEAIDIYDTIDWPNGIREPHHVSMEMEEVRSYIDGRIQEIEDKLERI